MNKMKILYLLERYTSEYSRKVKGKLQICLAFISAYTFSSGLVAETGTLECATLAAH